MRRRIARKILDPRGRHMGYYKSKNADLWSIAPLNYNRYCKACKTLHRKPYYDAEWWHIIKEQIK